MKCLKRKKKNLKKCLKRKKDKPKEVPKEKKDKPKDVPKKSKVIYSEDNDKVVKCEIDKAYLKDNVEVDPKIEIENNNTKNDMKVVESKDVKLLDSKRSDLLKPNKLMIVAHPDDEMLWGGMNLLLDSGWLVIVSTHGNKKTLDLMNLRIVLNMLEHMIGKCMILKINI